MKYTQGIKMVRALSQFTAKTFNILGMKSTPCLLQRYAGVQHQTTKSVNVMIMIFSFIHSFWLVHIHVLAHLLTLIPHLFISLQTFSTTHPPDCLCAMCVSFPASNCFLTCFLILILFLDSASASLCWTLFACHFVSLYILFVT